MTPSPIALATKDNASGQLLSGISAASLSIALKTDEGSRFPQAYNGTATSVGTSTTLNVTGISAAIGGSAAVGKMVLNKTDGSVARIKSVATDSITTTRLIGGTDNTWENSDVWCIDPFVVTFEKVSTSEYGVQSTTQFEEALVIGRSTDILTVATAGRGYNGTTANTFAADDYVYLHVTSPIVERLKDIVAELAEQVDTDKAALATLIADLVSTANAKGAGMIGVEDAAENFTGDTVEEVLTEIQATIDAATPPPTGSMVIWTTNTAPTGWLLCYGQAVSRATYAALYAIVADTFGSGDGSTTFNVPDMRGRFPLGQDDMGGSSANRVTATEADTLGQAAGTTDAGHTHSVSPPNETGTGSGRGAFTNSSTPITSSSNSAMPPYLTLNYIIKT